MRQLLEMQKDIINELFLNAPNRPNGITPVMRGDDLQELIYTKAGANASINDASLYIDNFEAALCILLEQDIIEIEKSTDGKIESSYIKLKPKGYDIASGKIPLSPYEQDNLEATRGMLKAAQDANKIAKDNLAATEKQANRARNWAAAAGGAAVITAAIAIFEYFSKH